MKGNVTKTGYWPDSPDRNNDFNIIPSNEITMEGMDMPLMGVSNTGDKKLMLPGKNYKFKGESVMETPLDKGIFLGAYKQVGGQLVPHDISVPNLSRQQGGSNFKTKLNPQEEQQFKQFYQTLPGNLRVIGMHQEDLQSLITHSLQMKMVITMRLVDILKPVRY
jgi:hypothetical protein